MVCVGREVGAGEAQENVGERVRVRYYLLLLLDLWGGAGGGSPGTAAKASLIIIS